MQLFLKVSKSTLRILPVKNVEIGRIYASNRSYKNWQPCAIIYTSHRHFTRFPRIFETRRDKAFACSLYAPSKSALTAPQDSFWFANIRQPRLECPYSACTMISLNLYKKKGEREKKRVSKESST